MTRASSGRALGQLPADRHQCLHRVLVRISSSVVSSLATQATKIGLSVLSLVCHLRIGKSADLPNSLDTHASDLSVAVS